MSGQPIMDQCARVEDLPDDDWRGQSWQEEFPSHLNAGTSHSISSTQFEKFQDEKILEGGDIWGPFKSEEEWQLAKWLIKNVGHTQAENFLWLNIVSHTMLLISWSWLMSMTSAGQQIWNKVQPSFQNKTELLDMVNQLPGSIDWKCECVTLTSNIKDNDGHAQTEELELWFWDPVDCVRELIGNLVFKDGVKFSPERLYTSKDSSDCIINEMWTADWWWDMQVSRRQLIK